MMQGQLTKAGEQYFGTLDVLRGRDVEVYWNVHKHVYSVRDRGVGRVVAHLDSLVLRDVTFRVSEAGRRRVLREGRKNVHAWLIGTVAGQLNAGLSPTLKSTVRNLSLWRIAYYNPYHVSTFVDRDLFHPIHKAKFVDLTHTEHRAIMNYISA